MAAPKGNQFWKYRNPPHGAPRKYATPDALWDKCVEYFEWSDNTPLKSKKYAIYQGEANEYWEEKPRPMLLTELCGFLGVTEACWRQWRKDRDDLFAVITRAEEIIWEQKFQGAAVDWFNHNIIAQELGLKTKVETSQDGETLEEFLMNLEPHDPPEEWKEDYGTSEK